ncbi:hypothetical protein GCM10012289_45960 [Nonomuraea cavernae]|uniref:Glucosamine kinase n=1 Tax=Nonomuraea cavernae TaxID=2045107 RepID=A0A917Z6D4_9ACTN|nr:hypothetical protein GCM10012289_45960 [Nonomuraea cavernae]
MTSLGERNLTERDRGLTAALITLLDGDVPQPFGLRRFQQLPSFSHQDAGFHPGVPGERAFGEHVDQTNYSVVVGDQIVVKWLTPPAPMPHPAVDVLAHLVEAGFNQTAPPYAALTLREKSGEVLLALVTGYLPGARDGWEWCVDEAEAGRTAFAADLGRLAADLHLALATFPGAGPPAGPLRAAGRAERALREALDLTEGDDGRWLASRAGDLRRELAPLTAPITTPLIRIHGDLHVGQILRWRDGYAVIDFDGNPTVTEAEPYQPAARDLAQLTTSLEHVAQVAVKRRGTPPGQAADWARAARGLLLDAYRDRLAERDGRHLLDESLIRPFEIEQECRELIYAARHLPRWRYAPMGVLRTWYDDTEETP